MQLAYRAADENRMAEPPLLRRPAHPVPRPGLAIPSATPGGVLPGFLRPGRACAASDLPDWVAPGSPVEIASFDPGEDILSLQFDTSGPTPKLSIERDEGRSITILIANGKPLAQLHTADADFSLRNVVVSRTAAPR